jgi:hypothetical protein
MFEFDMLSVYRGKDVPINKNIVLKIPTLDQIERFNEKDYFSAIYTFTSVGADMKWQLWDLGIDYTKINDYDLFSSFVYQLVGSRKKLYYDMIENPDKYDEKPDEKLLRNPLELILPDLDFSDFQRYKIDKSGEIVLYNSEKDITFDRVAYSKTVEIIRKIHGITRNNQIPANEKTKMDLIEDARDESMAAINKPFKSALVPLVSTMQMYCGQCGDEKIWDTPISAFLYNVRRIGKIQDAEHLLHGAYSGFTDLKGVDKNRIDMFSDIT